MYGHQSYNFLSLSVCGVAFVESLVLLHPLATASAVAVPLAARFLSPRLPKLATILDSLLFFLSLSSTLTFAYFFTFINFCRFGLQMVAILAYYVPLLTHRERNTKLLTPRPLFDLAISVGFRSLPRFDLATFCYLALMFCAYLAFGVFRSYYTDYFTRFMDSLPHGHAIQITESGKWAFCNQAMCKILQAKDPEAVRARMQVLQEKVKEKSAADSREFCVEVSVSSQGEAQTQELEVRGTKYIWDGCDATLYTVLDQTNVRLDEQSKAVSIAKARILRALSHELRTPINGTLNALEHCRQALGTEDQTLLENIDIALSSTNLLLNKYNDLLVFCVVGKSRISCRWTRTSCSLTCRASTSAESSRKSRALLP